LQRNGYHDTNRETCGIPGQRFSEANRSSVATGSESDTPAGTERQPRRNRILSRQQREVRNPAQGWSIIDDHTGKFVKLRLNHTDFSISF